MNGSNERSGPEKAEYLDFADIRAIFTNNQIWSTDNEIYWYEGIWRKLKDQGLTRYTNDWERYEVILRAVSLLLLYSDFSRVAFDEEPYFDYIYDETIGEYIPKFELGQVFFKRTGHYTKDTDYAVFSAADTYRPEIMAALRKERNWDELFFSLCAVHRIIYELNEIEGELCEEEVVPESTEQFWQLFNTYYGDVIENAGNNYETFGPAYDWMNEGASPLEWYTEFEKDE